MIRRSQAGRLAGLVLSLTASLSSRAALADAVTEWNEIMQTTALEIPDPFLQVRAAAITQVAVFEAVNALVGDYEAYLGNIDAPRGADPEAAAISAAHRVLSTLVPGNASTLDLLHASSLSAMEDGQAKTDGIAVGEAAADAILAIRAEDGSDRVSPYTPGTGIGSWQPTPPDYTPAFRPGMSEVTPFAIRSTSQFRLGPPPSLQSSRYVRDYTEVKRFGDRDGTERTPHQANVARFYAVTDAVPIYFPAARQVSQAQGKTLSENAHLFALLGMAMFDAAVACFDMKYHYNFWRPVTAIRAGDGHGQPPDPSWLPFVDTPPFPSYPSGHAAFGAAARRVLEALLGRDGHSITLSNPLLPDVVLHYSSWKQITDDVDDARVFGGVHFRFDQEVAARQGERVGNDILNHQLRPLVPQEIMDSRAAAPANPAP